MWSQWLSTFIIDLKVYGNFLARLEENVEKSWIAVHTVKFYDYPSKQDFENII